MTGKRVTMTAAPGSRAAASLREQLDGAERIASVAAELLDPPEQPTPLAVLLLDAAAAEHDGGDDPLAVAVDPDVPGFTSVGPLVGRLVAHWFGAEAADAEPFVSSAAAAVARRVELGWDPAGADDWVTTEIEEGRPPRLPRPGSLERDAGPATASFAAFLQHRNGEDVFARLFAAIASVGADSAPRDVLGAQLGSLEEAWLQARGRRRTGRGGSFGKLLRQALPLLRPYWPRGLEVLVYVVFGIFYSLLVPLSTKYFFDTVIPDGETTKLAWFIGFLFLLLMVEAVVGVRKFFVMNLVIARVTITLQDRMFIHLQRLPHDYYSRARVGDVASRFSMDVANVQGAIQALVDQGVTQILLMIAAAITLVLLSPILALVVLLTVPAFALVYIVLRTRLERASMRQQMLYGDVHATIQENLSAQGVVKALLLEDRMLTTYRTRNSNLLDALLNVVRVGAMFGTSLSLAMTVGELIVLGLGGYMVIQGTVTLGTLVAFLGLLPALFGTFTALAGLGQTVEMATGSLDRIDDVLAEPVLIEDAPDAVDIPELAEEIRLNGVSFGYEPDRPILNGLDLSIRRGDKVAIVGPSGSGKSTLANLLLRFWDPQAGAVRFDGVDIREATVASVRGQIGLVFQDTFIFDTTLRENIAFGRPDATPAEIEEAGRRAQLHELAESLPDGYDTVLGERGVRMSGGQRQRLSIARIILRNPPILILDEATSALDVRTEKEVLVALDELAEGRTTISITHRLASAANCDRVVVLAGGVVAEQGRHQDLATAGGLYQQLWDEQVSMLGSGAARVGAVESGLDRIPLLALLSRDALEALAGQLTIERYEPDEAIVKQGDPGDAFFVIGRGEAEVEVSGRAVRTLGEGDHFGELALLKDAPRSATIRALLPTEVYRLDRDDFLALCEAEPEIREAIERETAWRSATESPATPA